MKCQKNLKKMPLETKPVFWEKQEKYLKMLSAENFTQRAKLLNSFYLPKLVPY